MNLLTALTVLLSASPPLITANGGSFMIQVSEVKGPRDGETDELNCFNDDQGAISSQLLETTENLQCVLTVTRWLDFEAAMEVRPENRKKAPTCSVSSEMYSVRFKRDAKAKIPSWVATLYESRNPTDACHGLTTATLEYRPEHPRWTLRRDMEMSSNPSSKTPCPPKLVGKASTSLTTTPQFPYYNATFGPCTILLGPNGGTLKSDLFRMQKERDQKP